MEPVLAIRTRLAVVMVAALACACSKERAAQPPAPVPAATPAGGFLKGQTHAHSNGSGDSATPPANVLAWYEARGYDFVVFTDHERVTVIDSTKKTLAIPGVELTQSLRSCTPPEEGMGCELHMNALFTDESESIPWAPAESVGRTDRYARAIATTDRLNGIAQLNHPNFFWGANAEIIAELATKGLVLLEIANESIGCNNAGDATHPSTEAMWDDALTRGARVWGVASDDAHHYDDAAVVRAKGKAAYVGDLGWIMVRASKDPASIRMAITRGNFYSTNGVVLARLETSTNEIFVEAAGGGSHRFELIGEGGKTLATAEGASARFSLDKAGPWARAVVTDARGKKAWIQPVFRY